MAERDRPVRSAARDRTIDDDAPVRLARPRPGHPLVGRLHDRVEPWLAWFGVRRVVAAVVTAIAVVAGGWWLLRAPARRRRPACRSRRRPASPPPTPTSTVAGPSPPTTVADAVVVHVAGAVAAPGVYELPAGRPHG